MTSPPPPAKPAYLIHILTSITLGICKQHTNIRYPTLSNQTTALPHVRETVIYLRRSSTLCPRHVYDPNYDGVLFSIPCRETLTSQPFLSELGRQKLYLDFPLGLCIYSTNMLQEFRSCKYNKDLAMSKILLNNNKTK
jgi:hypothetical protein